MIGHPQREEVWKKKIPHRQEYFAKAKCDFCKKYHSYIVVDIDKKLLEDLIFIGTMLHDGREGSLGRRTDVSIPR